MADWLYDCGLLFQHLDVIVHHTTKSEKGWKIII